MKHFIILLLILSVIMSCSPNNDYVVKGAKSSAVVLFDQYVSPKIRTIGYTDVNYEEKQVCFHAILVEKGNPIAREFGFQVGADADFLERYEITCVLEENLVVNAVYDNWKINPPFYVRAFARSEYEVGYGDPLLVYSEYQELPRINLMIQSTDIGKGSWDDVHAICENSVLGGYTDWRLPTRLELRSVLSECAHTGSFTGTYWTSEYADASHHYGIEAESGAISSKTDRYKGRCVRDLGE